MQCTTSCLGFRLDFYYLSPSQEKRLSATSNRSEDSHLSNSTVSADCRAEEQGEERQRSRPNGQVLEMQELEKEAKPRAEEEHKEAVVQEDEDVEVEYNEVGIWEVQWDPVKDWKDGEFLGKW